MKIAQVNLGLLPMPPNGWGAVEKITWTYFLELQKLGHEVVIPYINEIQQNQYDIVHVHAWNHALELKEKNIPYIFTCHDHHAYIYGKDSVVYKNNLEAMRYSELAIVPAEYLVEYFENIPVYLQHGVDRNEFSLNIPNNKPKLLCVGNNGLIDNKTFDRKGFRYAIEAAKQLGLDITVVGPTNVNKQYFEENKDLFSERLTVLYDLTDKELQDVYKSHDILVHATSVEAGHPPLTILEAASCGLPVITTDCGGELHVTIIERNTNSVISGILHVLENYNDERNKTIDSVEKYSWPNVVNVLNELYKKSTTMDMKKSALNVYNTVKRTNVPNRIELNFIDGPFVEILGNDQKTYEVNFIDLDTNQSVFKTNVSNNSWAKPNRKWFTNWMIEIKSQNGDSFQHKFDLKNKRVFIVFESSSLGDTIAWIPYVDEFRKKHGCKVIVSTFLNDLFESQYPELEFVKPGTTVHNLYALFRLGVFYDDNGFDSSKHKTDYRKLRLQEIATDILGMDFKEIRPKLYVKNREKQIEGNYATIGIHSTAQLKYWNNGTGWQETVDYLNSKEIKTVHISKQVGEYMGNKPPKDIVDKTGDFSLQERITDILHSKMFIGISSGLSWIAWALGVPTILISGCTEEIHEPTDNVYRVINTDVCNSCFSNHYFDKGDWNWCPLHKGTERQFECSKQISFRMVQQKIDKILSI